MLGLRKFFNINIPSGETKVVQAMETYMVHWTSRHGEFSSDTRKRAQAFVDRGMAEDFKRSLEDAHKLIGNTSGTHVYITVERATGL